MMNIPEEHKTDPKHGYVVGGMFLLSKWIRENTPMKEHKYKVGDIVTITVECEVLKLTRDCDGTPLYTLDSVGGGWSEDTIMELFHDCAEDTIFEERDQPTNSDDD